MRLKVIQTCSFILLTGQQENFTLFEPHSSHHWIEFTNIIDFPALRIKNIITAFMLKPWQWQPFDPLLILLNFDSKFIPLDLLNDLDEQITTKKKMRQQLALVTFDMDLQGHTRSTTEKKTWQIRRGIKMDDWNGG